MKKFRINEEITAQDVRLVLEDKSATVIGVNEALAMARQQEKDLIEIYSDVNPPVCKILNYEKFMYQLQKEEKEHKKKSKSVTMKEVQFGLTIGVGDYKTKLEKTLDFLKEGHKIQLVVLLKKKQLTMIDKAESLINNIVKDLGDYTKIEKAPYMDKKKYSAILSPQSKKKSKATESHDGEKSNDSEPSKDLETSPDN
jgi:translation initiation factor IF-3